MPSKRITWAAKTNPAAKLTSAEAARLAAFSATEKYAHTDMNQVRDGINDHADLLDANVVAIPANAGGLLPGFAGGTILQALAFVLDNGGGATKPATPVAVYNSTTRTLEFTHPLGASALLLSTNNGLFGPYGGPISVGNSARDAGYYRAYVPASGATPASDIASSPSIAAAGVVLTPATVAFLGGQSNMVGVGNLAERTSPPMDAVEADLTREFQRVYIWNPQAQQFQKLQAGVNNLSVDDPTVTLGQALEGVYAGPEIGYAQRWEEEHPTEDLYIIKATRDGRSIDWWVEGGEWWNVLLSTYLEPAFAALVASGKQPVVDGWLWVQGESDRVSLGGNPDGYAEKLAALDTALTEAGFLQAETIRAISGDRSDAAVQAEQQQYVAGDPTHRRYWSTADYPMNSDLLHYNLTGQYLLGHRDGYNAINGTTGGGIPSGEEPGGSTWEPTNGLQVLPPGTYEFGALYNGQPISSYGGAWEQTLGGNGPLLESGGNALFCGPGGTGVLQFNFTGTWFELWHLVFGLPISCKVTVDDLPAQFYLLPGQTPAGPAMRYRRENLPAGKHTVQIEWGGVADAYAFADYTVCG